MHRFFSASENITGGKIIILDRQQVHHIKDVLRLKINEEAVVVDEKGKEYLVSIEELSCRSVIFRIKSQNFPPFSYKTRITVACAIPKKSKMDDIIDNLTQLGVDRIIPLMTERVVVRLNSHKKALRSLRWEKIALSSAKQSQRNTVPFISAVKDLEELLSEAGNFDLKLIAALSGNTRPLREVFSGKERPGQILILIGPEGDFTRREIDSAVKAGCIPVSLGDLVLRVETAVVAAVSFIRLREPPDIKSQGG